MGTLNSKAPICGVNCESNCESKWWVSQKQYTWIEYASCLTWCLQKAWFGLPPCNSTAVSVDKGLFPLGLPLSRKRSLQCDNKGGEVRIEIFKERKTNEGRVYAHLTFCGKHITFGNAIHTWHVKYNLWKLYSAYEETASLTHSVTEQIDCWWLQIQQFFSISL